MPTHIRKLQSNYIASQVDEELIIIHGQTGSFFSLKDVGFEIWKLLDKCDELESLCGELVAQYDVEIEDCRAAVSAFADELVDAGLAEYT